MFCLSNCWILNQCSHGNVTHAWPRFNQVNANPASVNSKSTRYDRNNVVRYRYQKLFFLSGRYLMSAMMSDMLESVLEWMRLNGLEGVFGVEGILSTLPWRLIMTST